MFEAQLEFEASQRENLLRLLKLSRLGSPEAGALEQVVASG